MTKLPFLAAAILVVSQAASAWQTCSTDKITRLVWHNDGNVYFSTAKKCPNDWCMVNIGSTTNGQDKKKMAYATLLSAYENGFPISIFWDAGTGNNEDCTPYAPGITFSKTSYFHLDPK